MKKILLLSLLLSSVFPAFSQVSISNDNSQPHPSAGLEVKFTDKGLLPPRMTSVQRNAIVSPATGLVIFNTDCNDLQFFNGTGWVPVGNTGMLATPGNITGNPTVCIGVSGVTYSISPVAGATEYSWNVPPGAIITSGQGATVITVNFGTTSGAVCVAAYNSCMKSNMNCLEVAVMQSPPVSVTITPTANPSCEGVPVTFTANPVNGGVNPTYQWIIEGIPVATGSFPSYTFVPIDGVYVSCVLNSNQMCASGNPATSNMEIMTVLPNLPVSVSVVASANPSCAGVPVTFTAIPVNGGTSPGFQWQINGVPVMAIGSTFIHTPADGDPISCTIFSNLACGMGNPSQSNLLIMNIQMVPAAPSAAVHGINQTQIIWKWHTVSGATGYKWNTLNDPASAINMGTDTIKTETGLTCNTSYSRYVWAYNVCGASVTELSATTSPCTYPCNSSFIINHIAGTIAPVSKTVTYGAVNNIPGEPTKCWITSNLGSNHQATSVDDATEASAGWYWQFNRKQGFKHDGAILTPAWTLSGIFENSDWMATNDPCTLELGAIWRIPTHTEYYNFDVAGGWTNWNGPWSSPLKLHASGCLGYSAGALYSRGLCGYFWSSTQENNNNGSAMTSYSGGSYMNPYNKAYGFPLRCLHD